VRGPWGIAPDLAYLPGWPPWFLDESGGPLSNSSRWSAAVSGRHRTGDLELRCLTQGGAGLSGPRPPRREQLGDCRGEVR